MHITLVSKERIRKIAIKIHYSKKKNFMRKGSHTIEAAFIMPVIISAVGMIIYLALFLYDYNLMAQSAYLVAFRGSNQESDKELVKEEIQKQEHELFSGKLFLGKSKIEEIDTSLNKTEVTYQYNDNLLITKEVTHFRPVDFIRICRTAEKLISK